MERIEELQAQLSSTSQEGSQLVSSLEKRVEELQVELKLADKRIHRRVHEAAKGRIARVLDTLHEINIPVIPLNTVEDVADQVRRLLGYAPKHL